MSDKNLLIENSSKLLAYHKNKVIKAALSYAYDNSLSYAIWRSPNSDQSHLIIDHDPDLKKVKPDLEQLPKGFLFSAFHDSGQQSVFLKADFHLLISGDQLHLKSDVYDFVTEIEKKINVPSDSKNYFTRKKDLPCLDNEQNHYINLVEQAMDTIQKHNILKIVPSRCKQIAFNSTFDVVEVFEKLCQSYPTAFISLVSIPEIGTWMGASPEILIKVDENNQFYTTAVAGTQLFKKDVALVDVAWTQKEIEEQALVSRYIINCFKKIRLREFEEDGPKTTRAGNLVHLRTDFKVDMEKTNFAQLGTVMLQLLHPTSAVCGMPMDQAMNFLEQNEHYNREFYSGYLGPVNMEQNTEIFVNIRSMQLLERSAIVYAGAGVTKYSNPQKEWLETEMKCNTLLDVISSE